MSDTRVGVKKSIGLLVVLALASASCSPSAEPGAYSTSSISESTTTTLIPTTTTAIPTTTAPTTTAPTNITTVPPPTTTTVATTSTSTGEVRAAAIVTRIPTEERVVALTFDAGSDRGFAAEILDMLAANDIKASFGMTGKWAESNPDLLRRMVNEGHVLVNHTYDHPHMETLDTEQRVWQLARTEKIIKDLTSTTTKPYFRPPYGSYNNQVLVDIASAGYRYSMMWTVDCLGWKGLPASEVTARCRAALQPGAILLMHVGAASTDYAALGGIIAAIDRAGYRYATIRELLP